MPEEQEEEEPKTAVGYIRRSQDEKGKINLSLSNQNTSIINICTAFGWEFICDPLSKKRDSSFNEGFTSGTKRDRPQLQRMISFVLDMEIDYIVIRDISRLGRDSGYIGDLIKKLKNRDVGVWSIREGMDLCKADETTVKFLLVVAEHQIIIGRKSQRGMLDNKTDIGGYFGEPPTGYRIKKSMIGVREMSVGWEIHENEAIIVKDMYERFINGETYSKIAKSYNKHPNSVKKILKNKKYCGYMVYDIKYRDPDGHIAKKVRREFQMRNELVPVIIDDETWVKASKIFNVLTAKYSRRKKK